MFQSTFSNLSSSLVHLKVLFLARLLNVKVGTYSELSTTFNTSFCKIRVST